MPRREYKTLNGDVFYESCLSQVAMLEWPNVYVFMVWSRQSGIFYRITTHGVLEYHVMRTGVGRFEGTDGIPLQDIYVTREDDFEYWSDRIAAFAKDGEDSGEPPICIEFNSHLLANRRRNIMTRDRDTGLLVVCRSVTVEEDFRYDVTRRIIHR